MVWGVSSSDVINYGKNTAVGFGVLAGCAAAAYVVKAAAVRVFAAANKNASTDEKKNHDFYSKCLGAAAGLATAFAAYRLIPGSRFALISDESTSKMFKLGIVQTVIGLTIDSIVSEKCHTAAIVGFGGAAATRFGHLVLVGFGALGAGLGSGIIQR